MHASIVIAVRAGAKRRALQMERQRQRRWGLALLDPSHPKHTGARQTPGPVRQTGPTDHAYFATSGATSSGVSSLSMSNHSGLNSMRFCRAWRCS